MKRAFGMFRGLGLAALIVAFSAAGVAHAEKPAKTADCEIESQGKVQFKGKCKFVPEGDAGSFTLQSMDGQSPLYSSVLTVSVILLGPTVAEVRGLTNAGINSRWGQARRSNQDRACWSGSDFKICAR